MSVSHTKATTRSGIGVEVYEVEHDRTTGGVTASITLTPADGGESLVVIFYNGNFELVSAPHTVKVDQTPGDELR